MPKHFIRKSENFICEVCHTKIIGTGYTNHCPNCLWSKHVDLDIPGDRASVCKGLMKPTEVLFKNGVYSLTHRCLKCKKVSKNKTSERDNLEEILKQ